MSAKLKLTAILTLVLIAFAIVIGIPKSPVSVNADSTPPYTITVSFKDVYGNSVANNKEYKTKADGKYSLSLVTITGYTFKYSTKALAGTATSDIEMTFVYEPIKLQVKVIYVDEDGVSIKGAPHKTYTVTLHDYLQLDLTKVEIDGYTYVGDKEIIPVTAVGNITVRLTYRKDEEGCSSAFSDNGFIALGTGLVSLAIAGAIIKIRRRKNV